MYKVCMCCMYVIQDRFLTAQGFFQRCRAYYNGNHIKFVDNKVGMEICNYIIPVSACTAAWGIIIISVHPYLHTDNVYFNGQLTQRKQYIPV